MDLFETFGYRRYWWMRSLVSDHYVSQTAPIVIGGCGSSGTTVIRRALNRHPEIDCGPESTVFLARISSPAYLAERFGFPEARIRGWQRASRSQPEFIDRFQAACLAASGKTIWAEKTPRNVLRLRYIFQHFPRARFVHVIRDGRDVTCSLLNRPWMKLPKSGRGTQGAVELCADYWVTHVTAGLKYRGDARYAEVGYEDFVADPEGTLRRLLKALGVPWHDEVLGESSGEDSRIHRTSIGRWKTELSSDERNVVARRAGDLLIHLGYADDGAWVEESPAPPEGGASAH